MQGIHTIGICAPLAENIHHSEITPQKFERYSPNVSYITRNKPTINHIYLVNTDIYCVQSLWKVQLRGKYVQSKLIDDRCQIFLQNSNIISTFHLHSEQISVPSLDISHSQHA